MTEEQYRKEAQELYPYPDWVPEYLTKPHANMVHLAEDAKKPIDKLREGYIAGRSKTAADLQSKLTAAEEKIEMLQADEWIATTDRLPANNEVVLCLQREWPKRMRENSYSSHCDQDETWFIKDFSHWRPSIAGPK